MPGRLQHDPNFCDVTDLDPVYKYRGRHVTA